MFRGSAGSMPKKRDRVSRSSWRGLVLRNWANGNPGTRDKLNAQIARLCNLDQMGELFKAIAIVPKSAPTPPGF